MKKEYIQPNIIIIEFSELYTVKLDTSCTFGDLEVPGDTVVEF